jgi:hypothetical protein
MPNWSFTQSIVPSLWVARPCVPGGVARIMHMDDYGNAVETGTHAAIFMRDMH